jgi:hypothetical protein
VATLIGFTFGCLFGFVAGYLRDSVPDRVASFLSVLGVSIPHYWLGMVLVIAFSVLLGWLPATGAGPDGSGLDVGLGAHPVHAAAGRDHVGDPDGHRRPHDPGTGGRNPVQRVHRRPARAVVRRLPCSGTWSRTWRRPRCR